jgi:mRNA-degrading endonuclease HigB of HigAB toxin-antitoxin module
MKTEIQKMNKKLNKLGYDFVGSDIPDLIAMNGLSYPKVSFQPTGFEGRAISALEISFSKVYITFLVSHNNLDQISVNVFDEDLFQTDEYNCSRTIELPLKKFNIIKLKQIILEECLIKSLSLQK